MIPSKMFSALVLSAETIFILLWLRKCTEKNTFSTLLEILITNQSIIILFSNYKLIIYIVRWSKMLLPKSSKSRRALKKEIFKLTWKIMNKNSWKNINSNFVEIHYQQWFLWKESCIINFSAGVDLSASHSWTHVSARKDDFSYIDTWRNFVHFKEFFEFPGIETFTFLEEKLNINHYYVQIQDDFLKLDIFSSYSLHLNYYEDIIFIKIYIHWFIKPKPAIEIDNVSFAVWEILEETFGPFWLTTPICRLVLWYW